VAAATLAWDASTDGNFGAWTYRIPMDTSTLIPRWLGGESLVWKLAHPTSSTSDIRQGDSANGEALDAIAAAVAVTRFPEDQRAVAWQTAFAHRRAQRAHLSAAATGPNGRLLMTLALAADLPTFDEEMANAARVSVTARSRLGTDPLMEFHLRNDWLAGRTDELERIQAEANRLALDSRHAGAGFVANELARLVEQAHRRAEEAARSRSRVAAQTRFETAGGRTTAERERGSHRLRTALLTAFGASVLAWIAATVYRGAQGTCPADAPQDADGVPACDDPTNFIRFLHVVRGWALVAAGFFLLAVLLGSAQDLWVGMKLRWQDWRAGNRK
jgi:hypothetical protein